MTPVGHQYPVVWQQLHKGGVAVQVHEPGDGEPDPVRAHTGSVRRSHHHGLLGEIEDGYRPAVAGQAACAGR